MEELQIEPELLIPPPRRTKRRGTRGFGTLFSQYFLLPIFGLTLLMLLWGFHITLVRVAGPVVSSQIVDHYRKRDSDDKYWLHYLRYRAVIDGKSQTSTELVDEASYQRTAIGSKVPLQISPVFPGYDSLLLIPGRDIWGIVWGLGFVSLLMLGGNGLLLWFIYILPVRRRRLVACGVPVIGRLIDKTSSSGAGRYSGISMPTYYFYYEYETVTVESALGTSTETVRMVGRQGVRDSDWGKPQIGESYTVLYDPKNPKFSVLYVYGDFEAVK